MHRRACRCAGHEPERHHVTTREVSVLYLNPHQKTGNDDHHVSLDDDDESRLVVTRRSPPETRRGRKKCDTRMTCVFEPSDASTRFSPFCVVHAPSPDPFAIRSRRLCFTAQASTLSTHVRRQIWCTTTMCVAARPSGSSTHISPSAASASVAVNPPPDSSMDVRHAASPSSRFMYVAR